MLFYFYVKQNSMFKFLHNLFNHKKKSKQILQDNTMKKYLIVGLGNIGEKYDGTRHNIGFKILDHFAQQEDIVFETKRLGDLTTYKLKGRTFILLKPSTYVNLSGKAVKYWLEKEKIPLENLLIITDDLNLPFGSFRLKTKGSDGGHKGLKDLQEKLGTTKYNRFRFGISDSFGQGRQVDYVLGKWSAEELIHLPERLDKSIALIKSFVLSGVAITMNSFNRK